MAEGVVDIAPRKTHVNVFFSLALCALLILSSRPRLPARKTQNNDSCIAGYMCLACLSNVLVENKYTPCRMFTKAKFAS